MVRTIALWWCYNFLWLFFTCPRKSISCHLHWVGSLLLFCYRPILRLLGLQWWHLHLSASRSDRWKILTPASTARTAGLRFIAITLPDVKKEKSNAEKDWWIFHISINFSSCKDLIFILPLQMNYIRWAFIFWVSKKFFSWKDCFFLSLGFWVKMTYGKRGSLSISVFFPPTSNNLLDTETGDLHGLCSAAPGMAEMTDKTKKFTLFNQR